MQCPGQLDGSVAEDVPERIAVADGIFADVGTGALRGEVGVVVGVVDDVDADRAEEELDVLEGLVVDAHEDDVAVTSSGVLPLQDIQVGSKRTRAKGLIVGGGVDVFGARIVPHLRDVVVGGDRPAFGDGVTEAEVFDAVEEVRKVGLDGADGFNRCRAGEGVAGAGVESTGAGRRVDEAGDALRAVHVEDLGVAVGGEAAGEEASVGVERPGRFLVRRPGEAKARIEVVMHHRLVLSVVTEAPGKVEIGQDLPVVLKKRASRYCVMLMVGFPAALEYSVGAPSAQPLRARTYCSTPVMVWV